MNRHYYLFLLLVIILTSCQSKKIIAKWSRECHDSVSTGHYWDKDPHFFTYLNIHENGGINYNCMCGFVRQLSAFPENPLTHYRIKKDTLILFGEDTLARFYFAIKREKNSIVVDSLANKVYTFKNYSLQIVSSDHKKYEFNSLLLSSKQLRRIRKGKPE